MIINSIQMNNNTQQNFNAQLKLKEAKHWNKTIADTLLANPKLQRVAKECDSDVIIFQSIKPATVATVNHSVGDALYKYSVGKERKNPIANFFMNTLGFGRVALSRTHHTEHTTIHEVIPNISYSRVKAGL